MTPWYVKILASIVNGLIFPFLLFAFRVTPWTDSFRYWNGVLVAFACTYLVYYYRHSPGASTLRTFLINTVISFLVFGGLAIVYLLIIILLNKLILGS